MTSNSKNGKRAAINSIWIRKWVKFIKIIANGLYTSQISRLACLRKALSVNTWFYQQLVLDVHPTADVLLQSLIFLLQPPKLAPAGLPTPSSCGPLWCRAGFPGPPYSLRWPGRTQSTASLLREKNDSSHWHLGAPVGRLTCGPTKLTRMQGLLT